MKTDDFIAMINQKLDSIKEGLPLLREALDANEEDSLAVALVRQEAKSLAKLLWVDQLSDDDDDDDDC